ncbi:MAG: diacylglycerol kinase family protein, partial [Wenzhouxiangellaceae bacterium]
MEDAVLTASRLTGAAATEPPARDRDLPARTLAALINPLSFRMSRGTRAQRSEALVRAHGGEVHEVTDLHDIESALTRIMSRPVDRLVIAGGDGTVQGAVTWLAEKCPVPLPELIVLSAGRSNYIAGDISTSRHFQATLERILTTHQENLHSVQRVTLKLQHPSLDVQHGFFMAGALVDQIIRDVHRWSEA